MSSPHIAGSPESMSSLASMLHQFNLNSVVGGTLLLARRILVSAFSVVRVLLGLVWTAMSIPLGIFGKLWYVFAVSPVLWCWRMFVGFFETVVTPIFCFAIVAGVVGTIGGLIVGGSALVVQSLIPLKKPKKRLANESSKAPQLNASKADTAELSAHVSIHEIQGELSDTLDLDTLKHRRSPMSPKSDTDGKQGVFSRIWDKNATSEVKSRPSSTASMSSLLSASSATSASLAVSPTLPAQSNKQASSVAADYSLRYMPTTPRDQILSYEDADGYFDYSPPAGGKSPELQAHLKPDYVLHARRSELVSATGSPTTAASFATIAEADEETISVSGSNFPSSRTTVTVGSK